MLDRLERGFESRAEASQRLPFPHAHVGTCRHAVQIVTYCVFPFYGCFWMVCCACFLCVILSESDGFLDLVTLNGATWSESGDFLGVVT